MIKEIIMKNVASYKEETKLDTENKRINLIYGLNGTGKSTMSDFLYKQYTDERFKDCKINGFNEITERILVYNKTFIEDNFYETNDLKGIFTLSKENKDSIEKINKANDEKKVLEEQKKLQEEKKKEENSKFKTDKSKKQDILWKNVINRYEHKEFDYCLERHRGSKDSFFNYIIKIPKTTSVKQIEELKKNITSLKDNNTEIKELEQIIFDNIDDIEKSDIFNRMIVGNTNSSFGKFIEKLKNSDWVKKGFDYLNEENKCPFCQQEISQELIENLNK
ncbi:AAA family ATPase, partial [Candidatus Ruminimicrobium bovinum]|uniref:AAA family ATPase n=1 Tax=Candidatus Ruminimicrobium bovinum TaxID=3242779 RepID=UPI0039B93542